MIARDTGEKPCVVVAGDNLLVVHRLAAALRALGYRPATASTAETLLRALEARPTAAVVDLAARGFDAVEAVRRAKENPETRAVPFLGFCGHRDERLREAARGAGCDLVATNGAVAARLDQLLRALLSRGRTPA